MRKQLLALILAVVLCLAMAAPALAAEDEFVIVDDGVLREYNGPGGEVIIPDGVTSISGYAIRDGFVAVFDANVTSVTIPNSVTSIGSYAFGGCTGLTSVTIPNSVTSIDSYAFFGCTGLTSVTIPESVTSIGHGAFSDCTGLTSVTIPDSVTSIRDYAFSSCTGLTSVTIPSSLTSIGKDAFSDTPWLEKQGDFAVVNEILLGYQGQGGSAAIPSSVVRIGDGAFLNCAGLTSVTIPDSVTTIGEYAFSSCSGLTNVTIPSSVTSIGWNAFSVCTNLTSVTIASSATDPSNVTSIGRAAFDFCPNLTSVTIPASVTLIEYAAFSNCTSLKDVYYAGTEAQWKAITIEDYNGANDPLFNATIHYNSTAAQPQTLPAAPTNDKLTVNGTSVTPTAYKINGANYFKLRDVAAVLDGSPKQFNVGYDNDTKSVTITTGQAYQKQGTELAGAPTSGTTAMESNNAVYINGVKTDLIVYKINGENYFKIRDLGEKLDFNVGWTAERGMFIEGDKSYDPRN